MKNLTNSAEEKKIKVKTTEITSHGKPRCQMVIPFKKVPFQPVIIIRRKSGEEIKYMTSPKQKGEDNE